MAPFLTDILDGSSIDGSVTPIIDSGLTTPDTPRSSGGFGLRPIVSPVLIRTGVQTLTATPIDSSVNTPTVVSGTALLPVSTSAIPTPTTVSGTGTLFPVDIPPGARAGSSPTTAAPSTPHSLFYVAIIAALIFLL